MNAGRFALTGVALATACLWGTPSWALGLGRINVQSGLGEALRAEIDVTSITPEESASLRLRVASPEAYRAAGIEYNSALGNAQVTLTRLPDGRPVVRVNSDRALLEPFVDVIIEATWTSGRLVREYTLLLDPPNRMAAAPPAAPPTPTSAAPAPSPAAAPPPVALSPSPPSPPPPMRPVVPPVASASPGTGDSPDEVKVRQGDSLSRIAARTQRPGVSLDQMLVALYRGNPQAFAGDNMNRLKAGAVLSVPGADAVRKIGQGEARDVIQAQSSDFAAYRQRLAAGVTTTADAGPARQATGSVAKVEDRKQAGAQTPDKLTLSQGSMKASAPEAKLSKESERKDASTRVAEISKNIEELNRIKQGAASAAAPAVAAAPKPAAPAAPAPVPPAPPPVVASAPAPAPLPTLPVATPSVPSVASAPAVVASAPAPEPAPAPAPAVAAKPPAPTKANAPKDNPDEPGFVSALLENPMVLPGAGVLVALLVGLGVYRARSRMRKVGGETSFLESRLQPDSFFGASGGQRIDTREGAGASSSAAASSSMSYSLSQLDAIGDVDPVAEADVYLAYGRDLQAEEILKEAMRANPGRMAIRTKLLEVYAKRRDIKGFELLATQVFSLTKGEGEDWAKAQEMGLQIDPENSLYKPGGQPEMVRDAGGQEVEPLGASTMPHAATPPAPVFTPDSKLDADSGGDIDLDLDFGAEPAFNPAEATQALQTGAAIGSDPGLDFDIQPATIADGRRPPVLTPPSAPSPAPAPAAAGDMLDFDLGDLNLDEASPTTVPLGVTAKPAMADVDFGNFILPGEDTTIAKPRLAPAQAGADGDDGDPLSRKLELAEEFRQIGDLEGARDLLEEVIAKADGTVRSKAQTMLDSLA